MAVFETRVLEMLAKCQQQLLLQKILILRFIAFFNRLKLVGGFNPSEKYERQYLWLFPIYGKIKVMFQSPPTRISLPCGCHLSLTYNGLEQPCHTLLWMYLKLAICIFRVKGFIICHELGYVYIYMHMCRLCICIYIYTHHGMCICICTQLYIPAYLSVRITPQRTWLQHRF